MAPLKCRRSDPAVGLVGSAAGEFMPLFGSDRGPELPGDQRAEDAHSLVFDSPPLDEPLALLGTPLVRLVLESDKAAGQVVVRLCEVAADGSSRRLSWGARNLALSDDLSAPRTAVGAGQSIAVDIPLFALADTLAAGNRLRIALSTSYWPLIWPAADSPRLTLRTEGSRLSLPVHSGRGDYDGFGEPVSAPTLHWTSLRPGCYRREEKTDPATGEQTHTFIDDMGTGRIEEIGLEISEVTTRTFRIRPDDPSSATLATEMKCGFSRGGWSAETIVRGEVMRPGTDFVARHAVQAKESGRTVFSRSWRRRIPL